MSAATAIPADYHEQIEACKRFCDEADAEMERILGLPKGPRFFNDDTMNNETERTLRNDALRDADKTAVREPVFGEWIKIEEGCAMPGDSVDVLVLCGVRRYVARRVSMWRLKAGSIGERYHGWYYGDESLSAWAPGYPLQSEPTHWMPLPPEPNE